MVGIPRSRGCLLCIRRRVRCDEGRPGCARCVTYGTECPGYGRSAKFVDGKHQVRRRAKAEHHGGGGDLVPQDAAAVVAHRWSREAARPGPASRPPLTEAAVAKRRPGSVSVPTERRVDTGSSSTWFATRDSIWDVSWEDVDELGRWVMPAMAYSALSVPRGLRADRAAFINTVLEMVDLDRPLQGTGNMFYGAWFDRVHGRLGRKVTLDSAVCSFALHLMGKARGDKGLVVQSRRLYGQSLGALQRALTHPEEWRSSETLCTAMVLCMFELFADTSGVAESWIQHSAAVGRLIQHRGTAVFDEPWDRTMLFSFRNIIIMNALFTGQDCFLAKKKWQRLLITDYDEDSPLRRVFQARMVPIIDAQVAHLARLPGVMRHGWAIVQARRHGLPVDPAMVALVRRSASGLHATYIKWFRSARSCFGASIFIEVPSNVPNNAQPSPYATVLAYSNPWLASLYLGYVTSMLIIQECLNQCVAVRAEDVARGASTTPLDPSGLSSPASSPKRPSEEMPNSSSNESGLSQLSSQAGVTGLAGYPTIYDGMDDPDVPPPAAAILAATPPQPFVRPYGASNRRFCRILYRSFETLGGGLMGQFRLGFSMRIAYEFADVPTQLWIRSLLVRSAKTFASSRIETYPLPGPNEYNYN